jgi:serine/threonine-protein kinase
MHKTVQVNQVGRYKLVAELAQGGMGTVYLGVARGAGGFSKLMVIKQLRTELSEDPQFLNMFLEEARLAARLNHPNIVQTTEVGTEGNIYFLAMEYLDGQALQRMRTRIGKTQEFPIGVHLKILVEALHGLHYAHELRDIDGRPLMIVHRDVSPHNVFVTYDGQVKVVDFGIAKAVDSSLETRTGELKGKIAYMPPEQATMKKVDRRADIFAIGVMLWEAIAQKRIWQGMNEMAIMHSLMTGGVPTIRSARPDVPPELERIVMRALALVPEHRQTTAEEMANELEGFMVRNGLNPTPREVGRMLSEAFAQDREELQRVIQAQLRKLAELPDTSPSSPGVAPNYQPVDLSRMGSATGTGTVERGTGFTQSAFTGPPQSHAVTATGIPQQKPFPVGIVVGLFAVMLVLAGLIFTFAMLHKEPVVARPPAPSVTVATPITSTTTTAIPAADRMTLSLTADPPSAKFFVDDTPVEGNPYSGPQKKDGVTHRIRVDAPGYDTERFAVVFDQDVNKQITMKKTKYVGGVPVKPPPSATASATADTTFKKPPREIDTAFPPH